LYGDANHKTKICRAPEWGNAADITALSLLYKMNIVLFSLFRHRPSQYVLNVTQKPEFSKTIYLKYNTLNEREEHYEAMVPKTVADFPPLPTISSAVKQPQSKTVKKTSSKKSKSPKTKTIKKKSPTKDTTETFIGETVAKQFQGEYYIGKVISYDKPYYKVRYEDDDEEEYTKAQLLKIMLR
jgi:hypothetical protein